jgi:hypothetical protein
MTTTNPAPEGVEDSPPRATLNQVLWEELQALRPEHCERKFAPTSVAAEDELYNQSLVQPELGEIEMEGRWQELQARRAKNLRELYERIGQMGRGQNPPETETPLSALCLSGGGIRSATFNLGVIQALARAGLLGKFDYLSSVSGGGYIASWLRSWIHRQGRETVLAELGQRKDVNPLNPEPRPVDHLREFSNYLTPKLGLFSADTWTLAAIIIRNLLLNWLVILPLLAALVALPQLAYLFTYAAHDVKHAPALLYAAIAAEFVASFSVHWHRRFAHKRSYSSGRIVGLCVVPVVVAACTLAAAVLCTGAPWKNPSASVQSAWLEQVKTFSWLWCLVVPFTGWLLVEISHFVTLLSDKSYVAANADERHQARLSFLHAARWELLGMVVSGAVASLLLYAMARSWLPYLHDRPALYTVIAVPCLLGLYLLARVLFVALASVGESGKQRKVATALVNDADREWWARMSGWILGLTLIWIAGTSLCVFGQWLLVQGKDWVQASIAAAGGIAGALGALLGSRDNTHTTANPPSPMHKLAMGLAAPVFAVCVIALIAWATATLGGWLVGNGAVFQIQDNLQRWGTPAQFALYAHFAAMPITLLVLALVLGTVVNVNRFSLHGMYRNRLVRAYLGGSNEKRRPDPFTGFDPADNLRMHALRTDKPADSTFARVPTEAAERVKLMEVTAPVPVGTKDSAASKPQRLLPIINITLNLLRDGKLAWQQRKAESFSVTPYYCGNFYEGYRDSRLYGGTDGITLGTAVTISGAAANPRMGYCSSPSLAFLMALFNVRLGAWLGNTNRNGESTYRLPGPGQALWALIGELFGVTTKDFKYVNLSDGGHFDNLGLYEVVLRRCRHILVSDAGCDGAAHFEDLGNAIRKIRIDFGIPIVFKKIQIIPTGEADKGLYCATAEIQYPAIDGDVECGQLVYIKPTISGRGEYPIPYDIYSYSKSVDSFPHESTTDQWFSESQFESYRKLGEHALEQVLSRSNPVSIKTFVEEANKYLAGHPG